MSKFSVGEKSDGQRLDIFLSKKMDKSRSQVQKMIKKNLVMLNGVVPRKTGEAVSKGDVVEIRKIDDPAAGFQKAETEISAAKINIVQETDEYLVIDKPSGILTHPTEAQEQGTVSDWILKNYPTLKGVGEYENRPGIVHRLDKEASGLLVIAKTEKMFEHLKEQFKKREIEKEYMVLVHGVIDADYDTIDFEVDRGKDGKMAARPKINKFSLKNIMKIQTGKEAKTEFWVERRFSRFTLLRVKIHTGRTHQIRVHMLAYGHPVVGDSLYINRKLNLKRDKSLGRIFLHASQLCFRDTDGNKACCESKLPSQLVNFLKNIN